MAVRNGHRTLTFGYLRKSCGAVTQNGSAFKIKILCGFFHIRNDFFAYGINVSVQDGTDLFAEFFEFFFVHPVLTISETTPDMIVKAYLFTSVFCGTVGQCERL